VPSFKSGERERIRARLRAAGAESFAARGLRKTTLDDLARAAGIAKSSFYSFFDNKEALYLDLMLEQAGDIAPRLTAAFDGAPTARAGLAALLREIAAVLDTNPLYRRLLADPDDMRAVGDRIGAAQAEQVNREMVRPLLDIITRAQTEGRIVQADPDAVLGVLQGVILMVVHADELPPQVHPQAFDLMIDAVTSGLTAGEHLA
jgi:AcrR family transcriptional regulator